MRLKLYNTIGRSKQEFIPLNPSKVRMYVCGPTVYDYPHLGNALAVVIYDILYRILRHIYGDNNVVYVRNITDVDDKIINTSKEQNIPINELTKKITEVFHDNINKLGCLPPNYEPKATEHINQMIEMIEKLIEQGFAYLKNGDVYFRVHKFSNYCNLSGRNSESFIAGARVEVGEEKENPEDFVLWKKANDNCFDSPFGLGRPGWHIECSAMSNYYLGSDFDIHGGGVDLIFPHHTNEIAQSCCAHPGSKYAQFWVHNGFLTVNGEKMSKSLNNFITIDDLLKKNIEGEVIRYVLLASHYRKPIDWNEKSVEDAKKSLDSFYRILKESKIEAQEPCEEFLHALFDDLNTPTAFSIMHNYATQYNKSKDQELKNYLAAKLNFCGRFLGFFQSLPEAWFKKSSFLDDEIEKLIELRRIAKLNKEWKIADKIRDELKEKNVVLEDNPDGSTSWRII